VHDALGILRRAGGVEDERRIAGGRIRRLGVRLADVRLVEVDDAELLVQSIASTSSRQPGSATSKVAPE
jgi:hypothetical protein